MGIIININIRCITNQVCNNQACKVEE